MTSLVCGDAVHAWLCPGNFFMAICIANYSSDFVRGNLLLCSVILFVPLYCKTTTLNVDSLFLSIPDAGVNAQCLAHLDKASIEAIASKLSVGGKVIFMDVCKKIKETVSC